VKRDARKMPDRPPLDRHDGLPWVRPPTITDAEKPLRRAVAMAYRSGREAGRSRHDALDAAEAAFFLAQAGAITDRLDALANVYAMIASAIQVDLIRTFGFVAESARKKRGTAPADPRLIEGNAWLRSRSQCRPL